MGKTFDRGLIEIAFEIGSLPFFGEQYGDFQFAPRKNGDRNAGGFDGQNFVDPAPRVQTGDLFSHFLEKGYIQLMIEKTADFNDVPGENLPFFSDFFFE